MAKIKPVLNHEPSLISKEHLRYMKKYVLFGILMIFYFSFVFWSSGKHAINQLRTPIKACEANLRVLQMSYEERPDNVTLPSDCSMEDIIKLNLLKTPSRMECRSLSSGRGDLAQYSRKGGVFVCDRHGSLADVEHILKKQELFMEIFRQGILTVTFYDFLLFMPKKSHR